MIRIRFFIRLLLSVLLICSAAEHVMAQADLPQKPEIQRITIDSTSGMTHIEWDASPSPGIIGYVIYTLDITTSQVTGYYLDSLAGDVLAYSYLETAPGTPYYTVTAVNDKGKSLLGGDYHRPVELEIRYDSCSSSMELEWEEYVGWEEYLNGYRIYMKSYAKEAVDPADGYDKKQGVQSEFTLLSTNRAGETTFTHEMVDENRYYEYVVEAFNNQDTRSTSNRKTYFTYMPAPPEFVSLDYVSVLDESTVELSLSADITGKINDFLVSRSASPEGVFTPVRTLLNLSESNVHLTDNFATRGKQFYYRVEALNSCFHPVKTSNPGNNILVHGKADESVVRLDWNPYTGFPGGVASYSVFRKNGYGEQELIATVSADQLNYTENIRISGDWHSEGALKYVVEAQENGSNPLGITGVSRSNEVQVDIETRMYLPNAFTPNDDTRNDFFAPVIDFIPEEFRMFIYDRTGEILFRSTDPLIGWDGSIHGSGKAREGVYVYHIEYLSFNGTRQIATGNVTLVYP
ncbi:MAG: gliding motility-associated C-terminal domain-containing protein [Bacteroidales bacterium]|nr:gliding motility-associated C-terminal domain-containing protein [Bacteroidales bacterium]MDT8430534.1 gliding motility-associated C-terminal domain-containing protein [Bacteroidales bacterium]